MGLEDRDYMRERRRAEARLGGGERDFDYLSGRYRWGVSRTARAAQPLGWLLSVALIVVPMVGAAKRGGWLPDLQPGIPFPASGSTTVSRSLDLARVSSFLTVRSSEANAVVQLIDPLTDRHVLSVYVGKEEQVKVPVPSGTYRIGLIEGQRWHGRIRFFGPNTSYETVVQEMTFSSTESHEIDLRRRPDGNLPTRLMITRPDRL